MRKAAAETAATSTPATAKGDLKSANFGLSFNALGVSGGFILVNVSGNNEAQQTKAKKLYDT
jgi:hypothetical protein